NLSREHAMNLNKLMKQAQKMQEKMTQAQAELAEKTVEVQAAGGKITVVANGAGDVISIKIAKEIVDPEDVEFLEDAVLSGIKQAIEARKAVASSEMSKITGGMSGAGLGLYEHGLSVCALSGVPLRCVVTPIPHDKENQRTKCPLGAPARGPCSIATIDARCVDVLRTRTLRKCRMHSFSPRGVRSFPPAAPINAHRTR